MKSKIVPRLLAAPIALLFVVLVVTAVERDGKKPKRVLPGSTFSASELERYKVTLKLETPDSGVETGILIVSGYYIPPPYELTVHNGEAFVDGVRVYPTQRAIPPPRDEAGLLAYRTCSAGRITESLRVVADSGVRFYKSRMALGADTTTALKAAESLMKTQPGVLRVGFSTRFQCTIYGGVGTWPSGRSEQVRYGIFFPRQRRPLPTAQISPDSVARMMGGHVMQTLVSGGVAVLGGGGELYTFKGQLTKVVRVMIARDLAPSQRWEQLIRELGPAQAYMCVANYEASRQGWTRLAAKLGVKP
jgi:hypothetical protein